MQIRLECPQMPVFGVGNTMAALAAFAAIIANHAHTEYDSIEIRKAKG